MGFLVFCVIIVVTTIVCTSIVVVVSKSSNKKMEYLEQNVLKTKIIDTSHTATSTSRAKTGSSIGRAVVGGMIAGPVGSIVGAGTAKRKTEVQERHTTTFMVFYKDGSRRHETVENGSKLYNFYMNKVEM